MAGTAYVRRRVEKECDKCGRPYKGTRQHRYCGPKCAKAAHQAQIDALTDKRRRARQSDKRCGWREGKPSQPGTWIVLNDFGETRVVTIDASLLPIVPRNVYLHFGPIPPPPELVEK